MADASNQGFLNSLFQWTVKNTSEAPPSTTNDESATTHTPMEPMTEERKEWLNHALENITVNPIERLKLCISKIKDKQTSEQQMNEFIGELCHWAEELDLAKDFFTIGGLDILPTLLDHNNDEIRIQGCSLIACLVQNNDHCQRIVVQSGLQKKLLTMLDESNNPDLKTKALTAISALIRGYTLGQLQLQKFQGAKILVRTIPSPVPRLQMKLCFLINTLCSTSAHMKKIFYENGAFDELIRLFVSETCPDHQHVLEAILSLSDAKPNVFSSLIERDPNLVQKFQEQLEQRFQTIDKLEGHHDEIALINQLRIFLSPPSPSPPAEEATNTK